MKMTTPIRATKENFARYGTYYNLLEEKRIDNEKYEEYMTADKPVYQPMRFGMTTCENDGVFEVDSMERHLTTEELLFAGDKDIVLSVADSDPHGDPKAQDVVSFLLKPGDLVVLNRGIWHDACHAVQGKAMYYFMAHGTGKGDEIVWHPVQNEPVMVEI